jgi:hypothetical protein
MSAATQKQSGRAATANPKAAPAKVAGKKKRRSRAKGAATVSPADFWRATPDLGSPDRIRPPDDPTALLRSLGTPPLPGQGAVADHYLTAVIERSSALATALAAAGGLLDTEDDPER